MARQVSISVAFNVISSKVQQQQQHSRSTLKAAASSDETISPVQTVLMCVLTCLFQLHYQLSSHIKWQISVRRRGMAGYNGKQRGVFKSRHY